MRDVFIFILFLSVLLVGGVIHESTTPDNPFESNPVVVNVEYENSDLPNRTADAKEALDYWNDNRSEKYGNWSAEFELRPNANDSDITIEFKEEIDNCGLEVAVFSEFVGCADIITEDMDMEHTTVEIVGDRTDWQVRRTIKHEFGHILGLNHSDEPQPLMEAEQ